jgi:hypothetical protein
MVYRDVIAVCSQIHTKHIHVNTLCGQNVELLNIKLVVPLGLEGLIYITRNFSPYRAVNTLRLIKTSQLMLYREIIVLCSQIHTKHINTLCGQNIELLNVKLAVRKVTTGP